MTGRRFSPDTPVFSTNKTDRHDITEILLKVELNTESRVKHHKSTKPSIKLIIVTAHKCNS